MTDNTFEVETTAFSHVARAPQESGILLTDFAAAYPSVNHSWIFHVLEKAGLPEFMCRFLRMIYRNSTTQVEFAGKSRGQFNNGQGRQASLSSERLPLCSGLLPYFSMAPGHDHSRKPCCSKLSSTFSGPGAYADDFAVAASSFRLMMTALSPAFVVVDRVAGLNVDHQ